jgi:hypothetical protein
MPLFMYSILFGFWLQKQVNTEMQITVRITCIGKFAKVTCKMLLLRMFMPNF